MTGHSHSFSSGTTPGTTLAGQVGTASGTTPTAPPLTCGDHPGDHRGPPPPANGDRPPPRSGGQVPSPPDRKRPQTDQNHTYPLTGSVR